MDCKFGVRIKMKTGNKVILNIKYGVLSQIVKILLQFVSRKVFIYFLGVELLGVNSLFASILSILSMTELGVGSAVAYSLYKPIADKDPKRIAGIMCLYRKVYRIIGIVVLAVGLMLLPFIPMMVNTTDNIPFLRLMFFIVLLKTALTYLLYAYSQTLLIASEQKYEVDKTVSLFYIITNIGEICVLLLTRSFIAYLIMEMVCLIGQQYTIYKKAYKQYPDVMSARGVQLEKSERKEIWKNVYGLFINKFAGAILSSIDNVIISAFISTRVVGIYSNYTMILAAATGIISMAFTSVTANIGRKFADKSISEEHFYMVFYLNFLICGMCTALYYLLINDFISIFFGKDLLLTDAAVLAITLNLLVSHMGQAVQVFKDASGIFWYGKYRPLVTCIINIVFSIILVKPFDIAGVVMATALSRIFTTVWFDPHLVFKYAFYKGTKKYWAIYLFYVIVISTEICLTNLVFGVFNTNSITIWTLVLKALIAIVICTATMMLGTAWMKEQRVIRKMVLGGK